MDCPECQTGKIRVIKRFTCTCGHHMLVCDNKECLTVFGVECGEPFGAGKLPPEHTMAVDETWMEVQKGILSNLEREGSKRSKKVAKEQLAQMIMGGPLLEDFKKSLKKT